MAISKASNSTLSEGFKKTQSLKGTDLKPTDTFSDNSLKHFWDFESENFNDLVGGLNLTASGITYSTGVNGVEKSAVILTGNGAYVDTNNTLSGTGALSYSVWVYTNSIFGTQSAPSRQLLLGIGNFGNLTPENKNIDLEVNGYDTLNQAPNAQGFSNEYGIHYWGNGVSFGRKVVYDQWVHIVFSYDGGGTLNSSTCRMWINGQGPFYPNRSFTATISSSYRLCIGRRYYRDGSTPDLPMNGKIDKVRIFNKALTQAEALILYNNGVAI